MKRTVKTGSKARVRQPAQPPALTVKLRAQTRKVLGKHYASKYRAGSS